MVLGSIGYQDKGPGLDTRGLVVHMTNMKIESLITS
jgi:hypothetical protein